MSTNTINSNTLSQTVMYNLIFVCCTIILSQYIGYYILKLTAKDIKEHFLGNNVDYNWFYFISFGYTCIAKISSGIIFGIFADLCGLKRAIQIPVILSVISLGIFFTCPSYDNIGSTAVIAYSIAHILYQISIAGEMQNIRLYITAFAPGYTGEVLALVPKFFAVAAGILIYQLTIYLNISFQYIFIILFIISSIVIFLRNTMPKIQINQQKSTSIQSIASNVYDKLSNNIIYTISQAILYGTSGGMLYFYCIFIKIFLCNKLQLIQNPLILQGLVILGITTGALSTIPLEKILSLQTHITTFIVTKIIILLIIIIQINQYPNNNILLFLITVGCIILGAIVPPILYLLRTTLPTNNKGTFLSITKNIGSLTLSNTTINMCFISFNYTQNIGAPFIYIILLLIISLLASNYLHRTYTTILQSKI